MNLKESVEQNVLVWLLGTLLTGFLAGIATYKSVQEIAGLEAIGKWELQKLRGQAASSNQEIEELRTENAGLRRQLQTASAEGDTLLSEAAKPKDKAVTAQGTADSTHSTLPGTLRGKEMDLLFFETAARQAVEIKKRIERSGMRVNLKSLDLIDPSVAGGFVLGTVIYGPPSDLPDAVALADALKEFGVHSIQWDPDVNAGELQIAIK